MAGRRRRENWDKDDQQKKHAFVERGRRLTKSKQQNSKQTKLDLESPPRSATPKRPRAQAGGFPDLSQRGRVTCEADCEAEHMQARARRARQKAEDKADT